MNRDDIICMAREAQSVYATETWTFSLSANQLERFTALVAEEVRGRTIESEKSGWLYAIDKAVEAEREECAKWADLVAREIDNTNNTASYIASGIRARGEQ
jgi:hypothetical protein